MPGAVSAALPARPTGSSGEMAAVSPEKTPMVALVDQQPIPSQPGIWLSWQNVCYDVKEDKKDKRILHGVSGSVQHPAVVEVHQLAREEAGIRMSVGRAHQRLQPALVLFGVVVEENHELGV